MNIWDMKGSVGQQPMQYSQQPYQMGNLMGGQQPSIPQQEEEIPVPPNKWIGDPSAMAAYGMTPPALPNPMTEMGNIMQMATAMHTPQQQQQPQQQGNLMSYLRMLSGA